MKRSATAQWSGTVTDGNGHISTQSGALQRTPYGFASRFQDGTGTNPEELIAAAHAGCFTMAFSAALSKEGFRSIEIETQAVVSIEKAGDSWNVTSSRLSITASVPGLDEARFQSIADDAKINCPISKLLNAAITLDARLKKTDAATRIGTASTTV